MSTPNPINVTFDIGDGRIATIETGKLARQAEGAVTVRLGDCIILEIGRAHV
jgi:polyribonucleotide nucleotidyltransferase